MTHRVFMTLICFLSDLTFGISHLEARHPGTRRIPRDRAMILRLYKSVKFLYSDKLRAIGQCVKYEYIIHFGTTIVGDFQDQIINHEKLPEIPIEKQTIYSH